MLLSWVGRAAVITIHSWICTSGCTHSSCNNWKMWNLHAALNKLLNNLLVIKIIVFCDVLSSPLDEWLKFSEKHDASIFQTKRLLLLWRKSLQGPTWWYYPSSTCWQFHGSQVHIYTLRIGLSGHKEVKKWITEECQYCQWQLVTATPTWQEGFIQAAARGCNIKPWKCIWEWNMWTVACHKQSMKALITE